MNFSQKLGLFVLIMISCAYIYFAYFAEQGIKIDFKKPTISKDVPSYEIEEFTPVVDEKVKEPVKEIKAQPKTIKIFVTDSSGRLRSVSRTCNPDVQKSCFEYAVSELMKAPTSWEKSKGFSSEIPVGTKIISIREGSGSIMIDLSSSFESGGGSDSIYRRLYQLIKTVNANTKLPVYLYINGKQANVIGGDGVMIKQPLNERSLDE